MLNCITSILLLLIAILSISPASGSDTLKPSESLSVNQTLISAAETFEFGFFTTNNRLYLGIWFYNLPIKTVVWVANRDSPARSSSVSLNFTGAGKISIVERSGGAPLWSLSSSQSQGDTDVVLQLLDSGNLVIREADDTKSEDYIWQSFDYPTDTLLPGQKIGWDRKTGLDRYPRSWSSSNDPSSGNYTFQLNRTGDPELILLKSGTQKIHRSGPWVGSQFSGIPEMKPTAALNFTFVNTPDEVYYSSTLLDRSAKFRVVLDSAGFFDRFAWVSDRKVWNRFWFAPKDQCDEYMTCGPNGVCNANQLVVCGCPQGFEPKNLKAWRTRYWSDGCVRKTEFECKTDGFVVWKGMKLPESGAEKVVVDRKKTLAECKEACRKECNCTAYANAEAKGNGCIMWRGELLDLRCYGDVGGQDLYVRLASSDIGTVKSKNMLNKTKSLIIGVTIGTAAILVIALITYLVYKRKHKSNENTKQLRVSRPSNPERSQEILVSGSIVSGKRDMSIDESGQGAEEFMNEVKVIAKLQHRNLVRLLGCCVDSNEKMLVYEYLPNKSLHSILFRNGYMSPEYAMDGVYSIKSDVFSFGVLVLEIVTGKKNKGFYNSKHELNLLGYVSEVYPTSKLRDQKDLLFATITKKKAWKMWKQGKGTILLDKTMGDNYSVQEVLRCIQVALLCVQERPEERPTMSAVLLLLSSETTSLPRPKIPAFCMGWMPEDADYSCCLQDDQTFTANQLTITLVDGR
ncbi:hypothetical protein V2J09_010085 [Rumex salicifolius]